MTDLEQLSVNVQRQIDAQNSRIDSVLAKVDMLVTESQQQREDLRATNAKFDAKFEAMDAKFEAKFDRLSEQIHTMTIAAVVGFGAIAAAIGGLIIAAMK